jgi:hypothetical protein
MGELMASYPRCSIASEEGYLQSCLPFRYKVLVIDHVVYSMGKWEPFIPLIDPSNLALSLESDITICVFLSPGFMDVEFPSDKAILEAMTMDPRPLSKMELYRFFTK